MIGGRVEARHAVPVGGVSVSAANSGGGPTAATVPAGNYYLTAAGGVAGLLATFQTQLNAARPPSSGAWSASLSPTTGQVTLDCDHTTAATPSFSLVWTSTALRDQLGFTRDIDYASTAAQMATDVGYGTWALGYLCNESSGALVPVFGAGNLTAGGVPTYSQGGPRGGTDKALTLHNSDFFSPASNATLDVGATEDIAFAVIAKMSALTGSQFTRICAKSTFGGGGGYFQLGYYATINGLRWEFGDAAAHVVSADAGSGSATPGDWIAIVAGLDRATNRMRMAVQNLRTGAQFISAEVDASAVGSLSNTATFTLGGAIDAAWTCAAFFVAKGVGAAAGLSANMPAAISTFAATFRAWTGTKQAHGVWFPESPVLVQTDPRRAPVASDARSSQTPTGQLYTLVGNTPYLHRALHWDYVPLNRMWEASAFVANASWETFYKETQLGLGNSWFTTSTPVQIYDDAGLLVGGDGNNGSGLSGWQLVGVTGPDNVQQSVPGFAGLFKIEAPQLTSSG